MRFITASGDAGYPFYLSGRSSGVERNLAKVDVVSSNLIARSIFSPDKWMMQNSW
tara:strand:- start:15021 stop:15185 length:165 start_codon:yes stop_codon:yes gene_type:complete